MTGLLRALTTGILAIAVAGAGFPNVLVARAATNTPPVITSVVLGVVRDGVVVPTAAVNEGETVQIDVTFADPDTADMESVTLLWAEAPTVAFTLMAGERAFFVQRTFLDDFPSNTPVDSIQFTVVISDLVNPSASATGAVIVHNVAPVLTAFAVTPAAILADQTVTAAGSFTDVGRNDSFTLSLDWGDLSANTTQAFSSRAPKDFSLTHLYLRGGSFTVTASVTDDDTGVATATAPVVVSTLNTAPSDLAATAGPALEGGSATLTVTFVDPDAGDAHTLSLEWGDSSAPQSLALLAGVTSSSPTHVYLDSGTYNATVKVADGAASAGPVTVVVTVANVAPTVTAETLSASSIVEQESVTVEATFTDPGASDTFTLTMDWGDTTSWSTDLAAGAHAASATHQYLTVGHFLITVTVKDRDNATGSMSKPLDVRARNHAPSGLTLTANSPAEGSIATLKGSFTDPDATDAHTVAVTWGDNSTGSLSLGAGAASFTATHTYATRGTYRVNVTVTDPAGLATSAAIDLVVQKKTECDWQDRFEQRLTWLLDHDTTGALARAVGMLSSRGGCDDEDDGDHRWGDLHGDMHVQVTVNTHSLLQSVGRSVRARRSDR